MDEENTIDIYEAYAQVTGKSIDSLLDQNLSEEQRAARLKELKDYINFSAQSDKDAFAAQIREREMELKEAELQFQKDMENLRNDLRVREADQKDEELKLQRRKNRFEYVKLGAGIATTLIGGGFAVWTQIRDYQMQEDGYMPSGFGKLVKTISDGFARKLVPKD